MRGARDVTEALDGHWQANSGMACCPAHEDRSPSLCLRDGDDGRLLLYCHAGCGFADILEALRAKGVLDRGGFVPIGEVLTSQPICNDPSRDDRSARARRIWNAASPIGGTLGERYLRGRGITCDLPPSLRYAKDGRHACGSSPTLLAKVTGSAGFAIHRTFLATDGIGKAAVTPAKMMLGPTKGGAVILSPPSARLVVAEGIETALSLLSGYLTAPAMVLAALSAGNMEALRLPATPGELIVAPDGDAPGQRAAHGLAARARLLGWDVSMMPTPAGADWNDVLLGKATCA